MSGLGFDDIDISNLVARTTEAVGEQRPSNNNNGRVRPGSGLTPSMSTSLELQRENLHFYLSETLLAAIEQMKWRDVIRTYEQQRQPTRTASPAVHSNTEGSSSSDCSSRSGRGEKDAGRHEIISGAGSPLAANHDDWTIAPNCIHSSSPALDDSMSANALPIQRSSASSPQVENLKSKLGESEPFKNGTSASSSGDSGLDSLTTASSPRPVAGHSLLESRPNSEIGQGARKNLNPSTTSVNSSASEGNYEGSSAYSPGNGEIISNQSLQAITGEELLQSQASRREQQLMRSFSTGDTSAEAIALALYATFAKKGPPLRATDLNYLVSESDTGQKLLGLPDSAQIPTDEYYDGSNRVQIRGSSSWAPLRMQIILRPHPDLKKRDLLRMQQYQCALCGTKLEGSTLKRIIHCEYLGRWMCPCCHGGKRAVVPARVLHQWDFSLYSVSDRAWKFLESQWDIPLYNLDAINPNLYSRIRSLRSFRIARYQLRLMWDYVRTCRDAGEVVTRDGKLADLMAAVPAHLLEDMHIYAMADLVNVHSGNLLAQVSGVLRFAECHITACVHCRAKGFVCELCNKDEIIFPFEKLVVRCENCGSCFHLGCRKRQQHSRGFQASLGENGGIDCPKCIRIHHRELLLSASWSESESEIDEQRNIVEDKSAETTGMHNISDLMPE